MTRWKKICGEQEETIRRYTSLMEAQSGNLRGWRLLAQNYRCALEREIVDHRRDMERREWEEWVLRTLFFLLGCVSGLIVLILLLASAQFG